jgi:hypothetical protein
MNDGIMIVFAQKIETLDPKEEASRKSNDDSQYSFK